MSCFFFFFFKQKTAYEMLRSLVGSEMCIRDRESLHVLQPAEPGVLLSREPGFVGVEPGGRVLQGCLLYTSDAADDLLCVDLGGRRILKKKKNQKTQFPISHTRYINNDHNIHVFNA